MSDTETDQPTPSRGGTRWGAVVAVCVAALGAILYGTMQDGGKKAGPQSAAVAGQCKAASARAAEIAPLARGEVAALSVNKTPKPAVDLTFLGPQGQTLTMAHFKGKAVLVNLWATWCLPCRAEMPALDRLQTKLGGDDFEVVAISIDTARLERRQAFLKEAEVNTLAFYADPKADVFQVLKREGKALGLPTTLLIDAQGCELGVMAGPAEWDSDDAIRLISAAIKR